MGLFDYVHCEVPLDGKVYSGTVFQTKMADSFMHTYTIKADGTLWREDGRFMDQVLLPAVLYVDDQGDQFHGDFIFYTSGDNDEWIEYKARFTEGKLMWIKRISE